MMHRIQIRRRGTGQGGNCTPHRAPLKRGGLRWGRSRGPDPDQQRNRPAPRGVSLLLGNGRSTGAAAIGGHGLRGAGSRRTPPAHHWLLRSVSTHTGELTRTPAMSQRIIPLSNSLLLIDPTVTARERATHGPSSRPYSRTSWKGCSPKLARRTSGLSLLHSRQRPEVHHTLALLQPVESQDLRLCPLSSPHHLLHGDGLEHASDIDSFGSVEPNDGESLLVVHVPAYYAIHRSSWKWSSSESRLRERDSREEGDYSEGTSPA